jgi:hypothetical protein
VSRAGGELTRPICSTGEVSLVGTGLASSYAPLSGALKFGSPCDSFRPRKVPIPQLAGGATQAAGIAEQRLGPCR